MKFPENLGRSGLATAAFICIVIGSIKLSADIITPFIFGVFLSVICMPIVNLLKKAKLPHSISVLTALTFMLAILTIIGQFFYSSAKTLSSNMREYYEMFVEKVSSLPYLNSIEELGLSSGTITDMVDPSSFVSFGVSAIGIFSSLSASFLLVMLITAFMLMEVDTIKGKVKSLSNGDKTVPDKIIDFTTSVRKYLLIKTIISLITGFIIGVGLYMIGVPHFLLFAVIAFFLNYIPTIGSIAAAIPAVLLAFIVLNPASAVAALVLFAFTNIILGSVVEPRFMGENLGLSTLVVFSSLLIFGWIFGSAGMLLAVPLTMIVKIAADKSKSWHWVSVAMGTGK